uniref:Uncharacterized protein n=1 Tax=Peronospora matthiolae TaxID=2874970 RepID=A0AAV1VMH2_9STRA
MQAQEHLRAGRVSTLSSFPVEDIHAEIVVEHAARGDKLCKHVIDEVDVHNLVLSGGISEAGETCINQIRCDYARHTPGQNLLILLRSRSQAQGMTLALLVLLQFAETRTQAHPPLIQPNCACPRLEPTVTCNVVAISVR